MGVWAIGLGGLALVEDVDSSAGVVFFRKERWEKTRMDFGGGMG